jgi:hypothetical protein
MFYIFTIQKLLIKIRNMARKKAKRKVGMVHRSASPRRRTTHRKTTAPRRRRRVGGIGKPNTDIMEPLAVLAGVVGAKFIANMLPSTLSAQTKGIIMTGAGLGTTMFLKDKTIKAVGMGVFASGGLQLLQGFGVLNGLTNSGQNPFVIGARNMRPVRKIAGANTMRAPKPLAKLGNQYIPMVMGSIG